MSVQPFINPKFRAFAAAGTPLTGGLLYTYAAGTSTPQATYTTRAGTVANANPVVLDANGEADVWTTPGVTYKFELRDSAGVVQWTVDNVPSLPAEPATTYLGSDGTAAAPGISFVNDTDSGLYRVGANDLAVSVAGTKVMEWTTATCTMTSGLTVTQSNANGTAVQGTGGPGNARGVVGFGSGNESGVVGTGGATSGTGVSGTGGGPNGTGIVGGGIGTGWGGFFTGGASGAAGVVANGTVNKAGILATGNGTAAGIEAGGGATGSGVVGIAGGTVTADTNDHYAVHAYSGHVKLSGGNPASSTAFTNVLTPMNFIKAWGIIETNGSGGATLLAGFNVASVTGGSTVTVTFASAFSSITGVGIFCTAVNDTAPQHFSPAVINTTQANISSYNSSAGTLRSMSTNVVRFAFAVLGAQ